METRHTKGPWRIDWFTDARIRNATTIHGADDMPVVHPEMGIMGTTLDQADANARLIAAAPELLEALRGLVKWLDDNGLSATKKGGVPPFTFGGDEYSVVTDARAAIAKATA